MPPQKAKKIRTKAQTKAQAKTKPKPKSKPAAQKIIDRRIKTASRKALRSKGVSRKRNVDVVFSETYSWISKTDSYLETREGAWIAMAVVLFFFGLVLAMVVVAFGDIYPSTEASSRRELITPLAERDLTFRDSGGTAAVQGPSSDEIAPLVSVTSPSSDAVLGEQAVLLASASDDAAVAYVELYRGSELIGTDSSAPYAITWSTEEMASGPANLTVYAYDEAGNKGTASVSVTVGAGGEKN